MRASTFALALLALASNATAEPGDSAPEHASPVAAAAPAEAAESDPNVTGHTWHLPRRRDREPHLEPTYLGEPDWNPATEVAQALKEFLRDTGLRIDLDTALYGQFASETAIGGENLGTSAWQSVSDWKLLQREKLGSLFVQWALLGSTGLNYDTGDRSMSGNVGSISDLNANVFPDHAALDEFFLKYV